ncbi:ATP-binding cassette domain-containing protein [Parafannyhessea umbonata]|uniref:ATP-binding cassette domain-containing protein n=1 Tax=Parafannyhessea umbonata TaxID=604330 RepID=UPI003AB78B53
MTRRPKDILGRLAPVVPWILAWQVASLVVGSSILLAGPVDTALRLLALLGEKSFLATVGFSLARIALGFLLAFALAVVLALVGRRHPLVDRLLSPGISALKSIPIVCIIVLLLMWVGSRSVSAIAVFLAVFPAVYFSCREALLHVDPKVSQMLGVFGVAPVRRFLAHTWPQVLPYLVGTSRNVCGMAWKAGVAAELIGSPMGSIGERIYNSKLLLDTADLFAWTIVVVVMSWLCERAFVAVLARTGTWSQRLSLCVGRPRCACAQLAAQDQANRRNLAASPGPTILLRDASVGYEGAVVASGLNLAVLPGNRVLLADRSGTGKTTLLHTVAGLQDVLAGLCRRPAQPTMAFQESRLVEEMSAVQNVLLVMGSARDEAACARVRSLLSELLPKSALDVPVRRLSGGQRRRVEIVRALAAPGDAVLLDEPFSSLDAASHAQAAAFVTRHLDGRALVVASHLPDDMRLLDATSFSLKNGR